MIKYELTQRGRRPKPIDKFSSKVERGRFFITIKPEIQGATIQWAGAPIFKLLQGYRYVSRASYHSGYHRYQGPQSLNSLYVLTL